MVAVFSHRQRSRTAFVCCAVALGLIVSVRQSGAAEDGRACSDAYAKALDSVRSAHLLEARDLLQSCARAVCGKVLYEACTAMSAQVEADIPSVVPVVTDGGGAPRADVQVTMDGEPLARIDGHAVPVDPGVHDFAFSNSEGVFARRKVLVVEGQHNRPISPEASVLASPAKNVADAAPETISEPATPAATTRHGSRAFTYSLASVGLAGLAGFGVMTEWGRKDNGLLAQCSPSCPQASVDHVRHMYLAADISLGVGIAALAGAYWAFVHARSADEEQPREQALLFDLRPTRAGAVAGVTGTFR
jgi:hypothetical protein